MAKEKKGAKVGRHSRNPSSKLQATRTARNKRLRMEANPKCSAQPPCPVRGGSSEPKPAADSWAWFNARRWFRAAKRFSATLTGRDSLAK